jgi:hypothetical protein
MFLGIVSFSHYLTSDEIMYIIKLFPVQSQVIRNSSSKMLILRWIPSVNIILSYSCFSKTTFFIYFCCTTTLPLSFSNLNLNYNVITYAPCSTWQNPLARHVTELCLKVSSIAYAALPCLCSPILPYSSLLYSWVSIYA